MKIKEVSKLLYGKIIIYEDISEGEFKDIFKGKTEEIPPEISERQIVVIGVSKGRLIEMQVKNN